MRGSDVLYPAGLDGPFADRAGTQIGFERWCDLREDRSYYHLTRTLVGDLWVSTVWTGVAIGLFETLVFSSSSRDPSVLDRERFSSEGEARAGHEMMVARWRDHGGRRVAPVHR